MDAIVSELLDDRKNDTYYKIQMTIKGLNVVELQWFDEPDYDESKWLFNNKYETKEEAQDIVDKIDSYTRQRILAIFDGRQR